MAYLWYFTAFLAEFQGIALTNNKGGIYQDLFFVI